MNEIRPVAGIQWSDGVVSNCKYSGVSVRDILQDIGVVDEREFTDWHVTFSSIFTKCEESDDHFESSVPISKALHGDVILAFKLNDGILPRVHGGPLRVIVPGYSGARSVKWVNRLKLQPQESDNYYMQHDYKILPENVNSFDVSLVSVAIFLISHIGRRALVEQSLPVTRDEHSVRHLHPSIE